MAAFKLIKSRNLIKYPYYKDEEIALAYYKNFIVPFSQVLIDKEYGIPYGNRVKLTDPRITITVYDESPRSATITLNDVRIAECFIKDTCYDYKEKIDIFCE
jgi:hypothetical protein